MMTFIKIGKTFLLFFVSVTMIFSCKSVNISTTDARPASKYYGTRWNTEHIRISGDPAPKGTTKLKLTTNRNGFVMPFCGRVTSEFGMRNGRMHTGIDIKLSREEPVYATFSGVVRMSKDYGSYGKIVVIRHDNGLETVYSHLNSLSVRVNQRVKAGEKVGGGGRTGNATAEHLHFETRFMGEPFNPRLIIDFQKCELKSKKIKLNRRSYK
jgi:murein DD-endopeptidase MepM/ murein hydrolase activator NlpD